MVWVTWRQHRGEAISALVVGLVFVAAVLLTGLQMHSAFDAQGVGGCLALTPPPNCGGVVQSYEQQFSTYLALYQWINVVPLILGIFVGAPLVAREVERNTHLLAWTQSVTRTRWILTKVALLVVAAAAAGTAYMLLMTWWRQPLDAIAGSALNPDAFDFEGIVPVGYFVAALSIGIVAGTVIRRTIPAMGVAIVGFLAVRLTTIGLIRPHFMAPLVSASAIGAPSPPGINGAWVLRDELMNPTGQALNGRFAFDQLCPVGSLGKGGMDTCLRQHGIVESITYQPPDRFWPFQVIEFGLFVGVSVLLLCVAVWWVRRRIS